MHNRAPYPTPAPALLPELSFWNELIYPAFPPQPCDLGKILRASHLTIAGWTLVSAVTLFSLLRMGGIVLGGSSLQFADYWRMLNSFLEVDGSLNFGGLFQFNNEHPMVVPQLLYWLNIKAFNGSNISLGLVDMGIVCLQLAVLAAMLRRSRLAQLEKSTLLAFATAILFALPGTWNFFKSMSGAAWLSSNLLAITAIYLRSADRHLGALVFATFATMSYGTGLIVWPGLLAVGIAARRPRDWWKEGAYLAGLVVAAVWVKTQSQGASAIGATDYASLPSLAAAQISCATSFSGAGSGILGWVPLIGTPILALWLGLWVRNKRDCCWIGLAAYAWTAVLLIVYGRGGWLAFHGCQGRYHSLAALTWIAFLVLALLAARTLFEGYEGRENSGSGRSLELPMGKYPVALQVSLLVALLSLTASTLSAGKSEVTALQSGRIKQDLREIAIQLDLLDERAGFAYLVWGSKGMRFTSRERMAKVGHYPFVESWNKDCGLLGQTLEVGQQTRTGGSAMTHRNVRGLRRGLELRGALPDSTQIQGPPRCILVTDSNNTVIGVGVSALEAGSPIFRALAPKPFLDFQVLVFDAGDEPIRITGTFKPAET